MKAASIQPVVDKFFGEIAAANLSTSEGGAKLTKTELEKASAHIKGLSPQVRRDAWADVVAVVGEDMDPGFLASLKTELTRGASSVRSRNNYMLATMRGALRTELPEAMQVVVNTTAQQEAVKAAVNSQITDPETKAAKAALLDLIDRARSLAEVQLIEKTWPTMVVKGLEGEWGLSPDGVKALEGLTAQFRSNGQTDQETVRKYVNKLRRSWATPVELGPNAPINGTPAATIAQKLDELIEGQNALRFIQSPSKMRVQGYRSMVDNINSNPVVQKILPDIKKLLSESERAFKAEQSVSGLVLDKNNLDMAVTKPYAKKLYELVQSVGKRMGFANEVELVIASSLTPNAFIYTADNDKPRVTFYTPIIEMFWDSRTQDWIKMWLDKDNKPAAVGAPGAREVSVGEYLIESVAAHELGHIRDQVVLTRATAIVMFLNYGRDMLESMKTLTDVEKAEMQRMMTEAQGMIAMMPDGSTGAPAGLAEKLIAATKGIATVDAARFVGDFTKEVMGDSAIQGTSLTLESMQQFIVALKRMSRVSEETADRYPAVLQGTAQWTSLCDAILGLAIENKQIDQQKIDSIAGLLNMGIERWADLALDQLAANAETHADLEFHNERSHPITAIRIKENFLFEQDKDEMFVQLKNHSELPPLERLLATVQLYEQALCELDAEVEKSKPHKRFDALGDDFKTRKLRNEVKALEKEMQPFLDYVNELLGSSPASPDNNAYDRMMGFIFSKENKLAQGTPYKRLLSSVKQTLTSALEKEGLSEVERNTGRQRLEEVQTRLLRYGLDKSKDGADLLKMLLAMRAEQPTQ